MTITDPPTLRIRTPEDLIDAIPYLVGHHPEESLVLVGANDTTVTVTARLDLADLVILGAVSDVLRAIRRSFATGVLAVAYTETRTRSEISAATLRETAQQASLELLAGLFVTDGRWDSLEGEQSGEVSVGTPVAAVATVVQAEATFAGMTALPNRQALNDMFLPEPGRDRLAADLARHQDIEFNATISDGRASHDRSAIRAILAAHREAQDGRMPADADVARFGVALQAYAMRDAAWLAIDDDRLPGIDLWVNLARRLPTPYDAAPLFLAAWRSYRDGNGTVAGIAAGLALASDPDYSAANLLLAALAHGVDPRTLRRLHANDVKPATTD